MEFVDVEAKPAGDEGKEGDEEADCPSCTAADLVGHDQRIMSGSSEEQTHMLGRMLPYQHRRHVDTNLSSARVLLAPKTSLLRTKGPWKKVAIRIIVSHIIERAHAAKYQIESLTTISMMYLGLAQMRASFLIKRRLEIICMRARMKRYVSMTRAGILVLCQHGWIEALDHRVRTDHQAHIIPRFR
jgi:hypothetical protein